jgi:hypothetical protein
MLMTLKGAALYLAVMDIAMQVSEECIAWSFTVLA